MAAASRNALKWHTRMWNLLKGNKLSDSEWLPLPPPLFFNASTTAAQSHPLFSMLHDALDCMKVPFFQVAMTHYVTIATTETTVWEMHLGNDRGADFCYLSVLNDTPPHQQRNRSVKRNSIIASLMIQFETINNIYDISWQNSPYIATQLKSQSALSRDYTGWIAAVCLAGTGYTGR